MLAWGGGHALLAGARAAGAGGREGGSKCGPLPTAPCA